MKQSEQAGRTVANGFFDMLLGGAGVRLARIRCRLLGRQDATFVAPNLAIGGRPLAGTSSSRSFDSTLDLTAEGKRIPASGGDYVNFPVPNGSSPTLEQTVQIVDWIDQRIERGGKVFVHCSLGRGRSSYVAACYLMSKRGSSAEEAFRAVKERRRYAHLNGRQVASLRRFEDFVKTGSMVNE